MRHTRRFIVKNRLQDRVFVSLSEKDGRLLVGVSEKDDGRSQELMPAEEIIIGAREVRQRCTKDGRLQFQVDNRTKVPITFAPDPEQPWNACDHDDTRYMLADERTIGGGQ